MKKKTPSRRSAVPKRSRFSLTLARGARLWAVLWVASLIFTQALLSSASNLLFCFVSLLPVASLIYLLISKAAIKLLVPESKVEIEKNQPLNYEMQLINESILPYPFVDAVMRLPTAHSVRTVDKCVHISMPPSTVYNVKNNATFKFRGTYTVGVSCLYVYDLFRIFKLRIDVNSFSTVSVLPRKLPLAEPQAEASADSSRRTKHSPASPERLEVADIREYRDGDTLKSVHWKLSSKTDELIVRDYNAGVSDTSLILCDMSKHFPNVAPVGEFVSPYAAEEAELAFEKKHAHLLEKAASAKNPLKAAELKRQAAALAAKKPSVPTPDVNALAREEHYADMNEYCADGVVEMTVALTLRELRRGRAVTLAWFDERAEIGAYSFLLRSESDFDMIFRLFATAPLAAPERSLDRLASMLGDSEVSKLIFVLPAINDTLVSSLCDAATLCSAYDGEGAEAVLFSAEERYAAQSERRAYLSACAARLAEAGVSLTDGKTMLLNETGGKSNE